MLVPGRQCAPGSALHCTCELLLRRITALLRMDGPTQRRCPLSSPEQAWGRRNRGKESCCPTVLSTQIRQHAPYATWVPRMRKLSPIITASATLMIMRPRSRGKEANGSKEAHKDDLAQSRPAWPAPWHGS